MHLVTHGRCEYVFDWDTSVRSSRSIGVTVGLEDCSMWPIETVWLAS
jgi:hypothetical protein